ncbi:cytochrome b/b6 domain-containing protein [Halpernia frigidisoli]|uniref:Thiosulfate reductase cytochrome b subunit n=1 Tax=Halpernia frigidisoli TaxID=1125876 RepID=A0A1I3FSZ8_9FLAO|nr:cytochrome b/b6 domain-containing protein [Halpernia frigidisoli]SFI14202.1 Thiosulfate reductase cytochrome b subunit [Halpernia frigidisoli]
MEGKEEIVEKHPLAIRWFHWVNFPILALMIWSGLLIYWASSVYNIKIGNTVIFHFFPKEFFTALGIPYRLAEGMNLHFFFMWFFFFNGIIYVLYLIFSKEYKYLLPQKRSFKEAFQVVLYDLKIRKTKPEQTKYNAAQRIAYTLVILMGVGSLLTGLAIYKPVQLSGLTYIFGGYSNARIIHFVLTILFCLFFLVHVIQVILAGWQNFIAMVRGFEVNKKKKIKDEE